MRLLARHPAVTLTAAMSSGARVGVRMTRITIKSTKAADSSTPGTTPPPKTRSNSLMPVIIRCGVEAPTFASGCGRLQIDFVDGVELRARRLAG